MADCLREAKTIAGAGDIRHELGELTAHAIQYTSDNGNIEIVIRESNTEVLSEIADNGVGMSHRELESAFLWFTRGDEPGKNLGPTRLGFVNCRNSNSFA